MSRLEPRSRGRISKVPPEGAPQSQSAIRLPNVTIHLNKRFRIPAQARTPRPGVGVRVLREEPVDILAISAKPHITEQDIRTVARAVSGSDQGAEYFMTHKHAVLGGRTPAEAFARGQGRVVLGMLLNAAGV